MAFGIKTTEAAGVPSHLYPVDLYSGATPDEEPFGEDIASPDARAFPNEFIGKWIGEGTLSPVLVEPIWLTMDGLRQPVVAIRVIRPQQPEQYDREIAIVTQQMDGGTWSYALTYLGVSPDRRRMTDLENMDCRWTRV